MNQKLDIVAIWSSSRGRVYLLWALLVAVGYVATHYFQRQQINGLWLALSIVGLGYMFRVMPLHLQQMKRIYVSWLVPIGFGMAVSAAVFYVDALAWLVAYLGAFWLLVQAVGFAWNGAVDPPGKWYYVAAVANALAALTCYVWAPLVALQYLIAAVVSTLSMLLLAAFSAP